MKECIVTDLGLASALCSLGYELTDIVMDNNYGIFTFFADPEQISELNSAYFDGTLQVEALAYSQAMKKLKARLYKIRNQK